MHVLCRQAHRTAHLFLSPLHVLARPPTVGPRPAARLAISLFPPYALFLSISLHLSFFLSLSYSLSPARSAISLRRAALPNASRRMPCMSLRPPSLEPLRPLVWWTRSLQLVYCANNSLLPRADLVLLIYPCTHARASWTITMAHYFHGDYSSFTQPCDALASLAKWNCSTLSRVASLWHRELHDRIDFETISPLAEGLIPGSKRSESIAPHQAVSAHPVSSLRRCLLHHPCHVRCCLAREVGKLQCYIADRAASDCTLPLRASPERMRPRNSVSPPRPHASASDH